MSQYPADEPPLTGRDAELRAIRASLTGPRAHGVLIAGAAGVGKTRLAQEASGFLEGKGWHLLPARTSGSGAGLPLAALAGLLLSDAGRSPGGSPALSLDPIQRALLGLRKLAARSRSILIVDDAHLLDEASAAVVHQVVVEGALPVLATVRTGEAVPDAVTALWKDAGVRRVDLAALAPADVDALVAAGLGGPVEGRTLRQLREASGGNPLFLRELLASVREGGLVDRSGGVWRLVGPLGAVPRLRELLQDRLATTEPAERDALELLAVGQPLPVRAALGLIGDQILERLERRGLVTVATAGRRQSLRLSHPLYAELLREATPELARQRHSRRLAGAVEALGARRGDDIMRVALWRLDGGGPLDPALMLVAAEQAAVVREYALAERLARRAYESGRGVEAGLAVVRALFQLGRTDDALDLCAELHQQATGDEERARLTAHHVSVLVHGADDVSAGLAALDAATVTDPQWRSQLDILRLYLRAYQLDTSVGEPAIAAFRTAGSTTARLAAAGAAGGALMLAGRYAEALALVAEAQPVALRHTGAGSPHADGIPVAVGDLVCCLPDPARAVALTEAAYESSLRPADRVGQALAAFTLARIALFQGRPATALRWAGESRMIAVEVQLRGVIRWAAGLMLQAAAQQAGAAAEAAEAAAYLAEHPGGPHAVWLFDLEVARGLAWHAALDGDADTVRGTLTAAVTRHGDRGAVGTGTFGALDLIRLGEPATAQQLLKAYPPPPDWVLGRTVVAYADAATAGDPGDLTRTAGEFAGYGMPLHAAEAAMLAAAAWSTAGEPRAATRARLLADRERARCEPAVTPALRLGGRVAGLTGRERELALAAARGELTRDIAGRLHLSERTVENHLHRAYAKLGVTGRAELRTALGPA